MTQGSLKNPINYHQCSIQNRINSCLFKVWQATAIKYCTQKQISAITTTLSMVQIQSTLVREFKTNFVITKGSRATMKRKGAAQWRQ